jgi:HD-GYP domain-containing protein (c-di-GMP phosphodiesterase class II)
MKSHDEYTSYHSVNVCILAITLGRSIGMDEDTLSMMALGALLHDIGKLRVDAAILQYPGRLDPEQWAEIKLHPQEGAAAILAAADSGQEVAAVVALEHHGRFDGAGYPGTSGRREPHLFSRVVTVIDVYDALTTRRSYRRAETPHQAIKVLRQGAGSHCDPDVVSALITLVGVYPPGSLLRLADDRIAMVTKGGASGVPEAMLVVDRGGTPLAEPEPIRLETETVVEEVMPDVVGVDPASMLEAITEA